MRDQLQTQVLDLNTELESEKENRKGVSYNLKKTERKLKNIVGEQDELQKKIEYLQVCKNQQELLFCGEYLHTKLLKFAKRSNDINGYTNRKKMEG